MRAESTKTTELPGGWIPDVGWVAVADFELLAGCEVYFNTAFADRVSITGELPRWLHGRLCVVTRWADGTAPSPQESKP